MMRRSMPMMLAVALTVAGCQTGGSGPSRTVIGAGGGAATGALIGGLAADDGGTGAALGALAGALAGGGIGYYLDQQAAQLERQVAGTGATVERRGNAIFLSLPGDVTFEFDSAEIEPRFYPTLDDVARTVRQYDETRIEVTGHTDSVGSDDYNQTLSEDRAFSVASYLVRQGVASDRVRARGQGELQPLAPNDTDVGRARNRRVDIVITPTA